MANKIKASAFVPALLKRKGEGYVYGATGVTCTVSLLKAKENQYGPDSRNPRVAAGYYCKIVNKVKDYTKGQCARWMGKRVQDCSNFIQSVRRELKQNVASASANGLYGQCKTHGPIATMPRRPGVAVFRNDGSKASPRMGHVGVYAGNGKVVESAGVTKGVIVGGISKSWTDWGMFDFVDYDLPLEGTTPAEPNTPPEHNGDEPDVPAVYVVVKGDSLAKIANRYDLNWRNIAAINNIKPRIINKVSWWIIHPGQKLRLK